MNECEGEGRRGERGGKTLTLKLPRSPITRVTFLNILYGNEQIGYDRKKVMETIFRLHKTRQVKTYSAQHCPESENKMFKKHASALLLPSPDSRAWPSSSLVWSTLSIMELEKDEAFFSLLSFPPLCSFFSPSSGSSIPQPFFFLSSALSFLFLIASALQFIRLSSPGSNSSSNGSSSCSYIGLFLYSTVTSLGLHLNRYISIYPTYIAS